MINARIGPKNGGRWRLLFADAPPSRFPNRRLKRLIGASRNTTPGMQHSKLKSLHGKPNKR